VACTLQPLQRNIVWLLNRKKTSNQPQFESELSLLKENAQYYMALCALELGNDDSEGSFS
jgi:hypothetical protein